MTIIECYKFVKFVLTCSPTVIDKRSSYERKITR